MPLRTKIFLGVLVMLLVVGGGVFLYNANIKGAGPGSTTPISVRQISPPT